VYYFCKVSNNSFTLASNEFLFETKHNGCKDALDFIIDSYFGYQIRNFGKSVSYTIVSNDHGFENTVGFWKKQGYDTKLRSVINLNGVILLNDIDRNCTAKILKLKEEIKDLEALSDICKENQALAVSDSKHEVCTEIADRIYNTSVSGAGADSSLDPILDLSL
jgi:hypothetical protein